VSALQVAGPEGDLAGVAGEGVSGLSAHCGQCWRDCGGGREKVQKGGREARENIVVGLEGI
jgi:hypothetical protein